MVAGHFGIWQPAEPHPRLGADESFLPAHPVQGSRLPAERPFTSDSSAEADRCKAPHRGAEMMESVFRHLILDRPASQDDSTHSMVSWRRGCTCPTKGCRYAHPSTPSALFVFLCLCLCLCLAGDTGRAVFSITRHRVRSTALGLPRWTLEAESALGRALMMVLTVDPNPSLGPEPPSRHLPSAQPDGMWMMS